MCPSSTTLAYHLLIVAGLLLAFLPSSAFAAEARTGALRGEARRARRAIGHHGSVLLAHGAAQADLAPDAQLGGNTGVLKSKFPYYHTTPELRAEAKQLAANCGGALTLRTENETGVPIDVARVRATGSSPVNRVFIIFGEHSRELISPESGLYFLKVLCGQAPADGKTDVASALKDSEFEMVLNGNPRSRAQVEGGAFCVRTNPDGVDLNRNWDEKWARTNLMTPDSNPGPSPFSEPETRIFKKLVKDFKPTTFLTVHSGTRGLYMPWAYDTKHLASRNRESMLQILKGVDQDHCQCPYGAAGKEVGYSCPGTCLDWVYDQLETPYAFAFEIYTNPERDAELRSRWDEKVRSGGASLLLNSSLAHPHFLDLFQSHVSDFVHSFVQVDRTESNSCFGIFNPDTHDSFDATLRNWAGAYLKMSQMVVADMRAQGNSQAHNASHMLLLRGAA